MPPSLSSPRDCSLTENGSGGGLTLCATSGTSSIPYTVFQASFCLTWAVSCQGSLNTNAPGLDSFISASFVLKIHRGRHKIRFKTC